MDRQNFLTDSQSAFLDIFRICAAMFVLFGHSFGFYKLTILQNDSHFSYIQNIGVVMLFILSGFLFAYSFERRTQVQTFLDLLKYRTLRFWKEYIPALIVIAFIDYFSIKYNRTKYIYINAFDFKHFIGNIFMLQDTQISRILHITSFGSARPLWTLAVEYWLYLLAGYIYIFMRRNKVISLREIIIAGILIFQSITHMITGRGNGLGFVFALGIFTYYFYECISLSAAKFSCTISAILYLLYEMIFKDAYTVYSFILTFIFFCSCIKITKSLKIRRNPLLSYISGCSFMIYLLHYTIIDFLVNFDINISNWGKFFLGITFSIALSAIMYYFVGYNRKKNL